MTEESQPADTFVSELSFARDLADEAIVIAKRYYKTDLSFVTKNDDSPVTIADETINRMVVDRIRQNYPADGVIGEEGSWQTDRERLWVCDPIDGTVDFAMGVPTSMFSIALVIGGDPVIAVTANLADGDIFWAVKNTGAFLNGKPLHVSRRPLNDAWLAFPTSIKRLTDSAELYLALADRAYQTNSIHGTVFKGMLIAQGLADASVWLGSVQPWDAAAMKLVVEEAGGSFSDTVNHSHQVDTKLTGGLIISNGIIHDEILGIVNRYNH